MDLEVNRSPLFIDTNGNAIPLWPNDLRIELLNELNQFDHACAMVSCEVDVCCFLYRWQSVEHCSSTTTCLQERMVILSIAHADNIVEGQFQFFERSCKSRRLVDSRRQDHDSALVEDDLKLQSSSWIVSNTVVWWGSQVATIERPTDRGWNVRQLQPLHELFLRRRR